MSCPFHFFGYFVANLWPLIFKGLNKAVVYQKLTNIRCGPVLLNNTNLPVSVYSVEQFGQAHKAIKVPKNKSTLSLKEWHRFSSLRDETNYLSNSPLPFQGFFPETCLGPSRTMWLFLPALRKRLAAWVGWASIAAPIIIRCLWHCSHSCQSLPEEVRLLPCLTSLTPLAPPALPLASHCAADQLADEGDYQPWSPFVRLTLTMNKISNGMAFYPKMSVSDTWKGVINCKRYWKMKIYLKYDWEKMEHFYELFSLNP